MEKPTRPTARAILTLAGVLAFIGPPAAAQEPAAGDLATAAQNPTANMIRLPLQNNTLCGVGPNDYTANVLNASRSFRQPSATGT